MSGGKTIIISSTVMQSVVLNLTCLLQPLCKASFVTMLRDLIRFKVANRKYSLVFSAAHIMCIGVVYIQPQYRKDSARIS